MVISENSGCKWRSILELRDDHAVMATHVKKAALEAEAAAAADLRREAARKLLAALDESQPDDPALIDEILD